MTRTIKIENTSGTSGTWVGQLLTNTEVYTIIETEIPDWFADSTVLSDIDAGNLKLIKVDSPVEYYTVAEAQRIYGGVSDVVLTGGQGHELLCTNPSGDLVWSQGSILIKEEGTLVNSVPFNTLNFVGASITATDATGGQTDITIISLQNIVEDTTPQLGGMLDVNGFGIGNGTEELIKFVETASAVNELTITNAATGNGPSISTTGADSDIDLVLIPKGTGVVNVSTSIISNVVDPVAAQDAATKNYVDATSVPPTGLTDFHDVFDFYEQGSTGDIYMMRSDSLVSNQFPGTIALATGRVVHVTSAREKSPTKYCDIVVRKQTATATAWSAGTWTDVGAGLTMNNTVLSDTYTNLSGYTFNAGDAIAVYLDKSTPVGGASCEDPYVRVYVKYD